MATRAVEILRNLYDLMMEINYHRPDDDVLDELKAKPDSFVEERLMKVRQYMAKHRAALCREQMEAAIQKLKEMKEKGIDEINQELDAEERQEYARLFRKFQDDDTEDASSILEDQLLLKLLERIRKGYDSQ